MRAQRSSLHLRTQSFGLLLCAYFIPLSTYAVIVADSFGPNEEYSLESSLIIGDNTVTVDGRYIEQALRFSIVGTQPIALESLQVAVRYVDGSPNQIDFHVWRDVNGLPGQIIESISIDQISPDSGGKIVSEYFSGRSILNPGVDYWLSASAPGGRAEGTMLRQMQVAEIPPRGITYRFNNGPWEGFGIRSSVAAFRITGTPIPEPFTSIYILPLIITAQIRRARTLFSRRTTILLSSPWNNVGRTHRKRKTLSNR